MAPWSSEVPGSSWGGTSAVSVLEVPKQKEQELRPAETCQVDGGARLPVNKSLEKGNSKKSRLRLMGTH